LCGATAIDGTTNVAPPDRDKRDGFSVENISHGD
jgi:hypothetical protein